MRLWVMRDNCYEGREPDDDGHYRYDKFAMQFQ